MSWASTSTSGTNTVFFTTTVRVVRRPLPPPKTPDQLWAESVLQVSLPGAVRPPEAAKVARALRSLGFSPERPWDAQEARRRYRKRARELHPDLGGDEAEFKVLSAAWDDLRRRGFVR